MTADELAAFVAEVSFHVDAISARLATIDPATLPAPARAVYDRTQHEVELLRMLTTDHVIGLLEAACRQAGREFTSDELRGLLGLQ